MAGPFVYIGTYKLKEGKLDEAKRSFRRLVEVVEEHEPRLIAFNVYFDEAGTAVGIVQVHPDAASMDTHMQVISEHLTTAYDVLEETTSEQLYGSGGERMVDEFRQWAPNATFTVIPHHAAGFTRSAAAG